MKRTESDAIEEEIKDGIKRDDVERIKDAYIKLINFSSLKEIKKISSAFYKYASSSACKAIYKITEEYVLRNNYFSLSGFLSFLSKKIGDERLSDYWKETYEDFFGEGEREEKSVSEIDGKFYYDDYCGEYFYAGEKHKISVKSYSTEIGKNMTALITDYGVILFDCGAAAGREGCDEMTKEEIVGFFSYCSFTPKDVKGVFVSHAHLDHYGSLNELIKSGISELKIFSDPGTVEIIRAQSGEMPPINDEKMFYDKNIKVESFSNGHILSSKGYVISFDDKNVVYTGDFCLHDQKTVRGLRIEDITGKGSIYRNGVFLAIIESTYGRKSGRLSYDDYRYIYGHFSSFFMNHKITCFLPAFAVGRSQELIALSGKAERTLVTGAAARMTKVYEKNMRRKIASGNVRLGESENFSRVIASSGMLARDSASYRLAYSFMNDKRECVMLLTGYVSKDGYGYDVMSEWIKAGKSFMKIPLSAHADRNEIIGFIKKTSPEIVVTVHGDGISRVKYENEKRKKTDRKKEGNLKFFPNEISIINEMRFIARICEINMIEKEKNKKYCALKKELEALFKENGRTEREMCVDEEELTKNDFLPN